MYALSSIGSFTGFNCLAASIASFLDKSISVEYYTKPGSRPGSFERRSVVINLARIKAPPIDKLYR